MTDTPQRRESVDFSLTFFYTGAQFLVKKGSPIKGLNDTTAGNLDGEIKSQLKKMRDADAILRDRDIDFDVHNGVVTVKGEVRTAEEKNKVTELVRAAPGVKDMANALEIKPPKT